MMPLILMVGGVLLIAYVWGYSEYSWWLIPLVVLLAVTYVLHPEIDHWFVSRHPLKLPDGMLRFIEDHIPAYRLLDSKQKVAFETATSVFSIPLLLCPRASTRCPKILK